MKLGPIPKCRMNTAKINDLPINDIEHTKGSTRYGLELLGVNESLVVFMTTHPKIYGSIKNYEAKHDARFVFDKINKGYRIWRTV